MFSSLVMSVISNFYKAVADSNFTLFRVTLQRSLLLILILSFLKALKVYLIELNALLWRQKLSEYFLTHTLLPKNSSAVGAEEEGDLSLFSAVDQIDQRISADIESFASKLAALFGVLASLPFIIVYYSLHLAALFGPSPLLIAFTYFFLGASITSFVMSPLSQLVSGKERLEGSFRLTLMLFLEKIEAIFFLRGAKNEFERSMSIFRNLLQQTRLVIRRHFIINTLVDAFAYCGSILNYCIIGYCLFVYSARNAGLSPGERAALLSQGSFTCMYLLSGFTTLISLYASLGDVQGLALRLHCLLDCIQTRENEGRTSSWEGHSSLPFNRGESTPPQNACLLSVSELTVYATSFSLSSSSKTPDDTSPFLVHSSQPRLLLKALTFRVLAGTLSVFLPVQKTVYLLLFTMRSYSSFFRDAVADYGSKRMWENEFVENFGRNEWKLQTANHRT